MGGMRQDECVHSSLLCETQCLSMRVGGHVGGYIIECTAMGPNLVSSTMGPGLVGFDPIRHLYSVSAFLLLCPMPMLGQDTRASTSD